MTTDVDIVNRALSLIGTRSTIASLTEQSNEAIAANTWVDVVRDEIARLAPWNCVKNFNNLALAYASPGTPENPTVGTVQWMKGMPPPPWAYEYIFPSDCLRPLWIVPQFQTGFGTGIPITTAVTGGAPAFWNGPPVKYQVGIDQFYPISSASVASGGSGYAVNDLITLAITVPPTGSPAVLQVTGVSGGVITSVAVQNGGFYFAPVATPIGQGSTTGVGTGATFNCTFGTQSDERVILTNQEFAILFYCKRVTLPDVMDDNFRAAWEMALAGRLVWQLSGNAQLANMKLQEANNMIIAARAVDGNEGLTINDVTPDWIRTRGVDYPLDQSWSPNITYDWGNMLTMYG